MRTPESPPAGFSHQVRRCFGRQAAHYDQGALLQAAVAWRLAHLLMGLSALLLFLPQGLPAALLAGALVGAGFAGVRVTGEVVMAKVIDLDAERTETHREGAYYSLVGLLGRAAGARSLGVDWGYHDADDLWAAGAFHIATHPDQIIKVVQ